MTTPDPITPERCPQTKFPDGTRCGEHGWHASNCPERVTLTEAETHAITPGQGEVEQPWDIALNLSEIRARHRALPNREGSADIDYLLHKVDELSNALTSRSRSGSDAGEVALAWQSSAHWKERAEHAERQVRERDALIDRMTGSQQFYSLLTEAERERDELNRQFVAAETEIRQLRAALSGVSGPTTEGASE